MGARLLPRSLAACALAGMGIGSVAAASALGIFALWGLSGGPGHAFLVRGIEQAVSSATDGGTLTLGDAHVGLRWFQFDGVVLAGPDGRKLVGIDRLIGEIRPGRLAHRELSLPHVRAEGVVVDVTADADGVTDLGRVFGGPADSTAEDAPFRLPIGLDLPDVEIRSFALRYTTPDGPALDLSGFAGRAAVIGSGSRVEIRDVGLVGQVAEPGPVPARVTGDLVYDDAQGLTVSELRFEVPHGVATANGSFGDTVAMGIRVDRIEAGALDPFTGDVGIGGTWAGSVALKGTGQKFDLNGSMGGIEESLGAVAIAGSVDRTGAAPAWSADVELGDLHVEDVYPALEQPVVLAGLVKVEGSGATLAAIAAEGTWTGKGQVLYGEAVDRVDAPFSIAEGVLHLDGAEVDGIIGDLTVSGDVDLLSGPVSLRVRGPLSPERLAARGIDGLDGAGAVDAVVTTDLKGADGAIAVDGSVRYAPFRYPDVVMTTMHAPFHATVRNGVTTGRATITGTGLATNGLVAQTLDASGVGFRFAGDEAAVSGPIALGGVDWDGMAGVVRAAGTFDWTSGGRDDGVRTAVGANLALTDWTVAGRPGTEGFVSVAMLDDDVRVVAHLADAGRPVLDTEGGYDLASAALVLDTLRIAPTPRATWTAIDPVRMTLGDGGVRDAHLAIGSELGRIGLDGTVGSTGPLDAAISVQGFELDHLAELWPDDYDGLAGSLDLALALSGDAANPVADGTVDLDGLFLPDTVRWLDASGPVHLEDHVLTPDLVVGTADSPLGHLRGRVPLEGGLADLTLDAKADAEVVLEVTPGDLQRLAQLSPALDDRPLPKGRFSAVVEAHDTLADPVLRLAGVAEIAVPGWDPAEAAGRLGPPGTPGGRVEFDLTRRASELALQADVREGLETRAIVSGTATNRLTEVFGYLLSGGDAPDWSDLELYADGIEASAALVGVPVQSLASVAGQDVDLGGELVGGLSVKGSPSRPEVSGAVNWLDARIGDQVLTGAYASVVPDEAHGYSVNVQATFPDGSLAVTGAVPVAVDIEKTHADWVTGDLSLDVDGAGVPLSVLTALDPGIRDPAGRLVIQGHVGGTAFAPKPELVGTIAGGRFVYQQLGLMVDGIEASVAVHEGGVRVDRADFVVVPDRRFDLGRGGEFAQVRDGERPRVSIRGSATLDPSGMPDVVEGQVTLQDGPWLIATDDHVVRANGTVAVGGSWPALAVDGDLEVVYGRVVLDAEQLEGRTPLELDPSLAVVRGDEVRTEPRPPDEPPVYAAFDVDLNLDLKRNLELSMAVPFVEDFGKLGADLSRADIAARLGGKVRMELQGGEPALVGQLEVVEGSARLLRSSLRLDDGTITFAGGDPYEDAHLDLHGSMPVSGGTLKVAIGGTPTHPEFVPSSEEYPDPTEQYAILLTGQAPDELSADQGSAATRILAQTVVSSLLSGRTLGTLSIEPDNSVRLGIPLSPTVYAATLVRPTVTDPDENALSVQVEWSPAPRLVLSSGLGDQVGWGDVFFEVRF